MSRIRTLAYLTVFSGLLVSASATLWAQAGDQMPQRGVYPNGSYTFDKIEAINQASGLLTITIPITSMPLGRGGMTVPVNLVYNSALFDTYYVTSATPPYSTYTELENSKWGGWMFGGFTYALVLNDPGPINCSSPGGPPPYGLSIVMPDGAHHPLKLYGTPDDGGLDLYWYDPEGGADPCTGTTHSFPMVYYTSDGTYIKVEINNASGSWTIFLPDGTTASGSGIGTVSQGAYYATSIADRNGNQVNISWNPSQNVYAELSDALGRSITIGLNNGYYYVSQAGFANGGTLTWTTGGGTTMTIIGQTGNCGPQGCNTLYVTGIGWLEVPSDTGTLKYQFGYNTSLGVLNSVTLPSGANTTYSWNGEPASGYQVSGKKVTWTDQSDGGTTQRTESWTYNYATTAFGSCSPYCTKITQPDNGVRTIYFHSVNIQGDSLVNLPIKEVEPDGSTTEYQWYQNRPFEAGGSDPANPYQTAIIHSAASSGSPTVASAETHSVDENGNVVADTVYDWIPYSSVQHDSTGMVSGGYTSGTVLRSTANTYTVQTPTAGTGSGSTADNGSAYWNPSAPKLLHLLARADTTGAGPGAITENSYDGNGNRTQERLWDSTKAASQPTSLNTSNASVTNYTYDGYGNTASKTDPRGTVTTYNYDSNHLYLTSKVENSNSNLSTPSFTTGYTFDFYSGLITSTTDPNGVQTGYSYDLMGRQTLVRAGAGTSAESDTQTTYDDANQRVAVMKDQKTTGSGELVTVTDYDQLGRVRLTRQLECSAAANAEGDCSGAQSWTDETAGIKVQTRYWYNGNNLYRLVSNPYRDASSSAAMSACSSVYTSCAMGWTVTKMDQNGRTISSQTFDGNGLPAPWGSNPDSMGTVSTTYNAQQTSITDEAGVSRTNTQNGAGWLSSVADATGTTSYGYDTLGNLTGVTQGSQSRSFVYDSLNRLSSSNNPEAGAITNTYDSNNNLLSKTDNRPIKTSYTYDALNRITQKTYSDSTPAVQYTYDTQGIANSQGRLTQENAGAAAVINYTAYDPLGRVTAHNQQTNGQTYSFSYAYNLAGTMTSETFPSGRVVSTAYDGANRAITVNGSIGGAQSTYISTAAYYPHGAAYYYDYGNGIFPVWIFNSRLQPVTIYATWNNSPNDFYFMETPYWGASNDNGNLQSLSEYVGNNIVWGQWTQQYNEGFTYDGVNRLYTAVDSNTPCGGTCWSQDYQYDRYGNMWISSSSGVPAPAYEPTSDVYNSANNHRTDLTYDGAGNTTSAIGDTAAYDAEDRLISMTEPPSLGGGVETYSYDSHGRRVLKVAPGAVDTVYVYDVSGQLAAEYTTAAVVAVCQTCFLTYDHLNSVRMVTDRSSPPNLISRHDYLPFGQEVIGYADRPGFGGTDNVTQRFTGKERDSETGLDYFGARYYANALGRFTAADEALADEDPANPQSWNLYTYVRNNPLIYIDRDGRVCTYDPEKNNFTGDCASPGDEQVTQGKIPQRYNVSDKGTTTTQMEGVVWIVGPNGPQRPISELPVQNITANLAIYALPLGPVAAVFGKIPESVAARIALALGGRIIGGTGEKIVIELAGGATVVLAAEKSGTNLTVTITAFAFGKLTSLLGLLKAAGAEGASTLTVVADDVINENLAKSLVDHGFEQIGPRTFAKNFATK